MRHACLRIDTPINGDRPPRFGAEKIEHLIDLIHAQGRLSLLQVAHETQADACPVRKIHLRSLLRATLFFDKLTDIQTFTQNEQVRVVTRSSSNFILREGDESPFGFVALFCNWRSL